MSCKLVFTILLFAYIHFGTIGALRIDINPESYTELLSDNVQISCLPSGLDARIKEVVLIEVYRNGESPLAIMHQNSSISLRDDVTTHFTAQGHVDTDVTKTYLNLTIEDPERKDTGIYTCIMFFLDQAGIFAQEKASSALKVERTDLLTLETAVKTLRKKIELLEQNREGDSVARDKITKLEEITQQQSDQIKGLISRGDSVARDKITKLEEITQQQSDQIKGLISRVTYTTAFMAAIKSKLSFSNKQVLVFSDVITQQGEGYDANTGIFTAPKSGLYAFHLALMAGYGGCKINVHLFANGVSVGNIEAAAPTAEDQSSISVVVDLKIGEQVKAAIAYITNCRSMYAGRYSLFSGYLIKAH